MLHNTRAASDARADDILFGRPCVQPRIKAIRLLITRGRRALANLSVGRKRASAVSRRVCDNRKAGSPFHPRPSPLSPLRIPMQSMSSGGGGGGGATSVRINPALRRIFFVPALFRPPLASFPGAALPIPSKPISYLAISLFLPLFFPLCSFFPLSCGASPASKCCGERIKRQSRFVAPITFKAIVVFPPSIPATGF